MTRRIIFTPKATQDLDDSFDYIAENDLAAALRFFDSTRLTIAQIARVPGMGSIFPTESPRLQGLRKWSVKDFRKYLIFYIEGDDVVEIVRILYAMRDIGTILEGER